MKNICGSHKIFIYNEVKRKKIKEQPMCADFLDSHSQALLSLID